MVYTKLFSRLLAPNLSIIKWQICELLFGIFFGIGWRKLQKPFFVAFRIIQIAFFVCEFLMRGSDDCWWTVLWLFKSIILSGKRHNKILFSRSFMKDESRHLAIFVLKKFRSHRKKKIKLTRRDITKKILKGFSTLPFPVYCRSWASPWYLSRSRWLEHQKRDSLHSKRCKTLRKIKKSLKSDCINEWSYLKMLSREMKQLVGISFAVAQTEMNVDK